MRLMVTGSRDWPQDEWLKVHDALDHALAGAIKLADPLTLLHGCADGPDSWADEWAQRVAILPDVRRFPPDYEAHGKRAPHVRNDAMLKEADRVVAFWDGKSRGTRSVIKKAQRRGIAYEVHSPAGVYVVLEGLLA